MLSRSPAHSLTQSFPAAAAIAASSLGTSASVRLPVPSPLISSHLYSQLLRLPVSPDHSEGSMEERKEGKGRSTRNKDGGEAEKGERRSGPTLLSFVAVFPRIAVLST